MPLCLSGCSSLYGSLCECRIDPWVPVRQWVLTLPHRRRNRLAWDHALCRAVLGVYAGARPPACAAPAASRTSPTSPPAARARRNSTTSISTPTSGFLPTIGYASSHAVSSSASPHAAGPGYGNQHSFPPCLGAGSCPPSRGAPTVPANRCPTAPPRPHRRGGLASRRGMTIALCLPVSLRHGRAPADASATLESRERRAPRGVDGYGCGAVMSGAPGCPRQVSPVRPSSQWEAPLAVGGTSRTRP